MGVTGNRCPTTFGMWIKLCAFESHHPYIMDYTQAIGASNEMQCMTAFIKLGYTCSIPFGNSAKYDFIVDVDGKLLRIQCKSSNYVTVKGKTKEDAFCINTTSTTINTRKVTRTVYTSKDIDYFATYFNNQVYVIPVQECYTGKTLRLAPPKSGAKHYSKAEDYLIDNVFTKGIEYLQSKEKYLDRTIIRKSTQEVCLKCGKPVSQSGRLCRECYNQIRASKCPSKEELESLIYSIPFVQIGKKFNVTDNAVRKWCIKYNLPYRRQDLKG